MSNAEHLPNAADWQPRLARWGRRLRALHLGGPAGIVLDVLEPLGPFGAHLLWVLQPTLRLIAPRADIASLARLLDAPGGSSWLRAQLVMATGRAEEQDQANNSSDGDRALDARP